MFIIVVVNFVVDITFIIIVVRLVVYYLSFGPVNHCPDFPPYLSHSLQYKCSPANQNNFVPSLFLSLQHTGQEPILFDATIADNIAYGCDDDNDDGIKISREQIIEAAKQANAYDFIMNFPDNFDTMINGGSNTQLSGGQKQRIGTFFFLLLLLLLFT